MELNALSPEQQKLDLKYMKAALKQAEKALAIGEVPIGAVIVYEGNGRFYSLTVTYPEEREAVEQIVSYEMAHACELSVPLLADCGWGANWLEAH